MEAVLKQNLVFLKYVFDVLFIVLYNLDGICDV